MLKLKLMVGLVAAAMLSTGPVTVQAADKDIVTTAVEAGSFKTLAAALTAGGLVETLQGKGPFTVFAPTDDAFAKLPAGTVETLLKPENKALLVSVLTYHVVPGKVLAADVVKITAAGTVNGQRVDVAVKDGGVKIDAATVVKTDIACSNGVIHVIDSVLMPSTDNIPATADKAGVFKTLLAAAGAAGLVDALSGEGPLTVFAPTDEAFAKLPKGTVETLLKPENKGKLADILKLHVVSGRVFSTDLIKAKEAKSLQGGLLKLAIVDGKAKVNGAGLVTTDVDASNGVIHIIDTVILPAAAPAKVGAVMHEEFQQVSHVCPTSGRMTYQMVRVRRHR